MVLTAAFVEMTCGTKPRHLQNGEDDKAENENTILDNSENENTIEENGDTITIGCELPWWFLSPRI